MTKKLSPLDGKKDGIVGRPIRLNRKILEGREHADVMFIGDVHYGSPQCDVERFLANIQYALDHHHYVMLMGDLCETATRSSVGAGVYEQECAINDQHEQILEWLAPLAKSGLILGTLRGNHEERIYKDTGFDVAKALARELGISYLGDACWNLFTVGGEKYSIYTLHGRSGSRFDGTALLAVERISTSFFCDMVAHGHSHKCINSIVLMQRVVNQQVVEHKKHLLITGHYLKYDQGYGQTVGLPISKLGSPKVKLFSNRHDILVSW